jgi:hypothetical protein
VEERQEGIKLSATPTVQSLLKDESFDILKDIPFVKINRDPFEKFGSLLFFNFFFFFFFCLLILM